MSEAQVAEYQMCNWKCNWKTNNGQLLILGLADKTSIAVNSGKHNHNMSMFNFVFMQGQSNPAGHSQASKRQEVHSQACMHRTPFPGNDVAS